MKSRRRKRRTASERPASVTAAGLTYDYWAPIVLRVAAVAAQAITIGITWPLWLVRHYNPDQTPIASPMLPAIDLPQFDVVWLLLGTLALVLIVPRWGV